MFACVGPPLPATIKPFLPKLSMLGFNLIFWLRVYMFCCLLLLNNLIPTNAQRKKRAHGRTAHKKLMKKNGFFITLSSVNVQQWSLLTSGTKVLFTSVLSWQDEESHRLCLVLTPLPGTYRLPPFWEGRADQTSDLSDFHLCVSLP